MAWVPAACDPIKIIEAGTFNPEPLIRMPDESEPVLDRVWTLRAVSWTISWAAELVQ